MSDEATTADLAILIGVHPQTIGRWAKLPGFPRPLRRKSPRGRVWSTDAVARWIEGCAAAAEIDFAARHSVTQSAAETRRQLAEERRQLTAELAERVGRGEGIAEAAAALGITYWSARKIIRSAGIKAGPRGVKATHDLDSCIDAVRTAAETAEYLSADAYRLWRSTTRPDAPSPTTLHRILGASGWSDVLRAAGLTPAQAGNMSPSRGWRRWSDEEMLDALARSGQSTQMGYERWRASEEKGEAAPSSRALIARFGSWRAAVALAMNERSQQH